MMDHPPVDVEFRQFYDNCVGQNSSFACHFSRLHKDSEFLRTIGHAPSRCLVTPSCKPRSELAGGTIRMRGPLKYFLGDSLFEGNHDFRVRAMGGQKTIVKTSSYQFGVFNPDALNRDARRDGDRGDDVAGAFVSNLLAHTILTLNNLGNVFARRHGILMEYFVTQTFCVNFVAIWFKHGR